MRRFVDALGRFWSRTLGVAAALFANANGGRSGDQSARALYEDRKDYRP